MEQIDLTDAACLTVPFKSKYRRLQMSSRIRVNAKQPIPKPNGKTMKSDTDLSSFDVVTMFFPLVLSSTKRDNVVPLHNLASNESQMEHIDFTPALWTCHD